MNLNYKNIGLTKSEENEIEKLLSSKLPFKDNLKNMWFLMDRVWDELNCNNMFPDIEKMKRFYSHPVWILNGLFIEQDELSMQHRTAVSNWIVRNPKIHSVLDYGGGYGTQEILIAKKNSTIRIDLYEPYAHPYLLKKISSFNNINVISKIKDVYDCVINWTVLEHCQYPLQTLNDIVRATKINGYLIIATDFYPVIKSHLPQTFHLRYTFDLFTRLMNLNLLEPISGTPGKIHIKADDENVNWAKIRLYEQLSKLAFPFLIKICPIISKTKKIFKS